MENTFDEILRRSVVDIIQKEEIEQALNSNKKLRVYLGIDPTSPNIHLGHTIPLRKLKAFQQLGHTVILLIGDFTAMIGDPTGRDIMRQPLTKEQVIENTKDYINQAKKIISIDDPENPVEIRYNSEWHGKESKQDMLSHAFNITIQQLIERDFFQERIKNNQPISLAEFIYPYLQGYDAVMLEADVQIGGTDQTFNMLMGRDLRKKMSQKLHSVITTPLILGTDGRKMSKSYGNTINLNDNANDIYGKIMSISDDLIVPYFESLTNVPLDAVDIIKDELKRTNPKIIKQRLAKVITEELAGEQSALEAEEYFNNVFVNKQSPDAMEEIEITTSLPVIELLQSNGLVTSKSEAQRLIDQGGVSFNGQRVADSNMLVADSGLLQIGKRRFAKITRR